MLVSVDLSLMSKSLKIFIMNSNIRHNYNELSETAVSGSPTSALIQFYLFFSTLQKII